MNFLNIDAIKANTAALRAELGEHAAEPLSEKDQAIVDAVNNGRWGCQDSSVRALVEAITGIACPKVEPEYRPQPPVGVAVNFTGETVIVTGRDYDNDAFFVRKNGSVSFPETGTYIQRDSQWTVATDEEIDAFFA